MTEVDILREQVSKSTLFDPPIGVYVVTVEGDFVECNDRVREILNLPPGAPLPASIRSFYFNPAERDRLLSRMREELTLNSQQWMDVVIRLKVEGREKFVQDFSRAVYDQGGKVIGFLCCMIDITEEQLYRRLLSQLPVGLYQLNERDEIIEISQAAIDMLGYGSRKELLNTPFRALFADREAEEKFEEFKREIIEHRSESKKVIELTKKSGESIFASLSAFLVSPGDGSYMGQEGTMVDVTTEELYRSLQEHVPVGLYRVMEKDGRDIITDCNEQFAKLNGLTMEEAIGYDIRKHHASPESYSEYMKALDEQGEEPLLGHHLPVRTKQGKEAIFEVNCRLRFDGEGRRIGRAGSMRDVSERARLEQKIVELTEDIGVVLHTFSSSLVKMRLALEALRKSQGADPFKRGLSLLPERASEELKEPAERLAQSVDDLIGKSSGQWAGSALPREKWERLAELSEKIRNFQTHFPRPSEHPPTLRTATLRVLELCEERRRGRVAKGDIREIRKNAAELLRVCSLITLHQLLDLSIAMEYPVFALREFVTSEERRMEARAVCKASYLISQAINYVNEFAANRGVTFRFKITSPDAEVEVIERDLVRALDNLFHNAVKYSWKRSVGEAPFVQVRSHLAGDRLVFEVENWGVPIPKEEITKGLIFRTGFRGRKSSDRGRVGTGIGLADARRVVREHGGELSIRSEPAGTGKVEGNYEQPFLTTATITLPLHPAQGATK